MAEGVNANILQLIYDKIDKMKMTPKYQEIQELNIDYLIYF